MRRSVLVGLALFTAAAAPFVFSRSPVRAADNDHPQAQTQTPPAGGDADRPRPQGMGGPGGMRGMGGMAAPVDSFGAVRDSFVDVVMKQIAGRENAPAESVYKDIQTMKGAPAGRLLRAMDSFGHALGVNCTYCHDASNWAKNDHVEKNTARDMMKMTRAINEEYLSTMSDIKSEHPGVNCGTCHHGIPRPGSGPMSMRRQGG